MVDTRSLSELSTLARKLNNQTDELNMVIVALNDQLAALKLGLEVWLTDHPLEDSGLKLVDRDQLPPQRNTVVLGYCRVNEKWQLAVKTVTYTYNIEYEAEGFFGAEDEGEDVSLSLPPQPLLNASRSVRLSATTQFDALVFSLKQKAVEMLEGLESAKKLAAVR